MFDTANMSAAEISVMGTTVSIPKTIVPEAALVTTSTPAMANRLTSDPGGGAGTSACTTAIVVTAPAVHNVTASAPHLVLPRQNSAPTRSVASAEHPPTPDWSAGSTICTA